MIAVDTNILIHADREEMPLHREAVQALRTLAEGHQAWALPVFCVGEFLRVVSHRRVFDPATPVLEALDSIDAYSRALRCGCSRQGIAFFPCSAVRCAMAGPVATWSMTHR